MFQTVTGHHSLRYKAAMTWNSLPETTRMIDTLESIRHQMKTMLFRQWLDGSQFLQP